MNLNKYGFVRVKAISPVMEIGNVSFNVDRILEEVKKANNEEVSVALFPEMSLCGYTVDDLVHQQYLLNNVKKGLSRLLKETKDLDMVVAVGLPYQMPDGRLYNCAFILKSGQILGASLKQYLPNYNEFYDMRYFTSGLGKKYDLEFDGQSFVAGNQVYQVTNNKGDDLFSFAALVCEDDWAPREVAVDFALNGANLILNLSASNELVGKAEFRKNMLSNISSKLNCAYMYASSGPNESTKDTVFGGDTLVIENGTVLSQGERFNLDETRFAMTEIDFEKLNNDRRHNTTFATCEPIEKHPIVKVIHEPMVNKLSRKYLKNPFVPSSDPIVMDKRAEEIMQILSTGVARLIKGTGLKNILLGLSGGMDSTLVSLISLRALKKLNLPSTNLITISMPGLGTSNRTRNQARDLALKINSTFKEIDIVESTNSHLKNIAHTEVDVVVENAQARERTKILLDLANKYNGFMISGSSLTELATSNATFGGDSISHLNILGSCPKSLSKFLIRYEIKENPELKDILERVLGTTISAELIPTVDKSIITQSSEDFIGNYDVVDFCIYYQIRNGFGKNKIKFLLSEAYADGSLDPEYLNQVVENYFKRFYAGQFKRTMAPQSIKLGVSLSPRSDWRMPDLCKYENEES